MGTIRLTTFIRAPIHRCFDLSRSVDLHLSAAGTTNERAIGGVTSGMMNLGDEVTWEARHFGVRQCLTTRIVAFDSPRHFRDSQVHGVFARFDHDHFFEATADGTTMSDVFDFACPLGALGRVADPVVAWHLRRFLLMRNEAIRATAESDAWRRYLPG